MTRPKEALIKSNTMVRYTFRSPRVPCAARCIEGCERKTLTTNGLNRYLPNLFKLLLAACILAITTGQASAEQRGVFPPDMPTSYRAECASCHVPFAPGLLPAETWHRILSGLAQHYGVDAAIDTNERDEIESFLVRNAGQGIGLHTMKKGDRLRLTDTLWFHRRHGTVKTLFQYPLVGSKANCGACHVHAEDGRYEEYTPLVRQYMQKTYPAR